MNLLNEAIPLKKARKMNLTRKGKPAYRLDKLDDVFHNSDRIIYPIDIQIDLRTNPLVDKISRELDNEGMYIGDYVAGIAYRDKDVDKKQPIKIGRILHKLNQPDLLDAFKTDPMRQAKKTGYSVVISRHPYDIAGSSTDRNWTSCMNLGFKPIVYPTKRDRGINARYVAEDIYSGSLVAYLVDNDDVHQNGKLAVRRPLSRILMKPHTNKAEHIVWSMGRTYGVSKQEFSTFIRAWLTDLNADASGKYALTKGLYPDMDVAVGFQIGDRIDNDMDQAFHDIISYENEKYLEFFETTYRHAYYGDAGDCEIKVNFSFTANEVPVPESSMRFEFYRMSEVPKYIRALKKNDLQEMGNLEVFEIFAGRDTVDVTIEYSIQGPQEKYDDYDAWYQYLEEAGVDDFVYKEERNTIRDFLRKMPELYKTEKTSDYEKVMEQFKSSDQITKAFAEIKKNYKTALEDQEIIVDLWNSDLEETRKKVEMDKYKNAGDRLERFLKDWSNYRKLVSALDFGALHSLEEKNDFIDRATQKSKIRNDFHMARHMRAIEIIVSSIGLENREYERERAELFGSIWDLSGYYGF